MYSTDNQIPSSSAAGFDCELLTTHIDDLDHMEYTTYGICVKDRNDVVLFDCLDISTDRAYVESFIRLILNSDVAALHVPDLLEDYLD